MRNKVAIRFGIEGDLRFISHHDTMRLFERALARACLPLRFSEGFNPHPKLSLPLPRGVGIASQCELLVIELIEVLDPQAVMDRLQTQMPRNLKLFEAWAVKGNRALQIERVEYALALPATLADQTASGLEKLLGSATWPVERSGVGRTSSRTIDLRAYLVDASFDTGILRWMTRVTGTGSPRPAEVLGAVGLDPRVWYHRVRRTAIHLRTGDGTKAHNEPADCRGT